MSDTPIEDLALLSDCHSAALVSRTGSVEWWCVPRFDSPSVFGRLLDDSAGHFSLHVSDAERIDRVYDEGSLTLVTRVHTADGECELTDALAMAEGVRGHDLGIGSPHRLLRRVRCTTGSVSLEIQYSPRFEYGMTVPLMKRTESGILARGGPASLVLSTGVPLEIDGGDATGNVVLEAGDEAAFAVEYGSSWDAPPGTVDPTRITSMLEDTSEAWRSWGRDHQRYMGPYAEFVGLSGRILQALTYRPTGAMIAAPTTSLPETVGGSRNWDYRYAWVRDASFTLDALWVAACPDEEQDFFRFLTTAASSVHVRRRLQIMFGIGGERDLSERTLPWLAGWRGSSPVRVGNGAWSQVQNDVYGELLAVAHRLQDQLGEMDEAESRFFATLADVAAEVWREPDQGIWEMRGEPRHHLYSKLMCWVALDRAAEMAEILGVPERVPDWSAAKTEVRDVILSRGWNDDVGAFTQSFDSETLDASALVIPIVGFLPGTDPRVLQTIEAIERDLTDDSGLVFRYRGDDGLEGEDGMFLLCTFWLAEAHALAGHPDKAREVFERALACANDLGLMSEEIDPHTGAAIGNFPQAFSHMGLVNAAWAIGQAEEKGGSITPLAIRRPTGGR
jgi:GH15 family glucan-1,4-alpha-glucosidase